MRFRHVTSDGGDELFARIQQLVECDRLFSQRAERDEHRHRTERELEKVEREVRRLIEAIKSGVPGAAVKDEMTALEARRVKLRAELVAAPPPMPRLHPNLAELYRQKVINLAEAMNADETRLEAAECLRELIEEIRLVPHKGKLRIELYGELASLINLANGNPRSKGTGVQVTLVAGVGFVQERTSKELRKVV